MAVVANLQEQKVTEELRLQYEVHIQFAIASSLHDQKPDNSNLDRRQSEDHPSADWGTLGFPVYTPIVFKKGMGVYGPEYAEIYVYGQLKEEMLRELQWKYCIANNKGSDFQMAPELVKDWLLRLQASGKLPDDFMTWRIHCGDSIANVFRKAGERTARPVANMLYNNTKNGIAPPEPSPLPRRFFAPDPSMPHSTKERIFPPNPSYISKMSMALEGLLKGAHATGNKVDSHTIDPTTTGVWQPDPNNPQSLASRPTLDPMVPSYYEPRTYSGRL